MDYFEYNLAVAQLDFDKKRHEDLLALEYNRLRLQYPCMCSEDDENTEEEDALAAFMQEHKAEEDLKADIASVLRRLVP